MRFELVSDSEKYTEDFGAKIAAFIKPDTVIALDGDLGAGKTVFTRGFCRGMGVTSHVQSPTFTIVNEYKGGRLPVFHFDTYRLEGSDDFLDAGLDEYFDLSGVCVIEWSSVIEDLLPQRTVKIMIRGVGDTRDIEVSFDEDSFDEEELRGLTGLKG